MEVTWYGSLTVLDPDELYPERSRPLSHLEFDKLTELGAFEDERVELLYGQLVAMSPQSDEHVDLTARLHAALVRQLDDAYLVASHSSLRLWLHSVPEPDLVVMPRRRLGERPRSAYLVIEVAESSLRKDQNIKAPLYAEAGIPTYWLVDRAHDTVHVFTAPAAGRYDRVDRCGLADTLTCADLPGVAIAIAELFAP